MSGAPSSTIIHCSTALMSSAIWGVRLGEVGLGAPAAAGEDGFQDVRAHANLPAEVVVTRERVWPASKATRTRSQASRVLSVPICRRIACSMIGCRSTACWMCSFWRTASRRKAAPVAETLKPSCRAIRSTSALTSRARPRWSPGRAAVLCWVFVIEQRNCPTAACARPQSEAQAGRSPGARSPLRPYLAYTRSGRPFVARYDWFESISRAMCCCPLFIAYLVVHSDVEIVPYYQNVLSFCKQSGVRCFHRFATYKPCL